MRQIKADSSPSYRRMESSRLDLDKISHRFLDGSSVTDTLTVQGNFPLETACIVSQLTPGSNSLQCRKTDTQTIGARLISSVPEVGVARLRA